MAGVAKIYVDTCCFVNLVKSEIGTRLSNDEERDAWFLKNLLQANRDGEVDVLTSTVTIAECQHAGEEKLSEKVKSQFSSLLTSGQYVKLVQCTPFIAIAARDLRWQHKIHLRGADAIHLASALEMECQEILTANGRFGRIQKHANSLSALGIVPRQCRDTQLLPDKYRQMSLDDGQIN